MKTNRWPGDKILATGRTPEASSASPRAERLVFTNGCFDILHRGHVEYLHQAKALGDILVVGVNTDCFRGETEGPGETSGATG